MLIASRRDLAVWRNRNFCSHAADTSERRTQRQNVYISVDRLWNGGDGKPAPFLSQLVDHYRVAAAPGLLALSHLASALVTILPRNRNRIMAMGLVARTAYWRIHAAMLLLAVQNASIRKGTVAPVGPGSGHCYRRYRNSLDCKVTRP